MQALTTTNAIVISGLAALLLVVIVVGVTRQPEQVQQSGRMSQGEPTVEKASVTAVDVKLMVVETAMHIHQEGLMPEPREIHAQEACKLWFEHGSANSASYWEVKAEQAAASNMDNALPVLVIMQALVAIDETYVAAGPAIDEYCEPIVRAQTDRKVAPRSEDNILRLLERKAIFPSE